MNNLLSVFIGGLLAIAGGSVIKWMEYSIERRSLRAAIRAEIAGILEMVTHHGHGNAYREAIDAWRQGRDDFEFFVFTINENFTPVYQANVGKVGMLGADVAGDVVRFYDMMIGVRADLRAHINGDTRRMSPKHRADRLESGLEAWEQAMALGTALLDRL